LWLLWLVLKKRKQKPKKNNTYIIIKTIQIFSTHIIIITDDININITLHITGDPDGHDEKIKKKKHFCLNEINKKKINTKYVFKAVGNDKAVGF